MLTRAQYERELFWSRFAYWAMLAIPTFVPFGWTRLLWAPAGFYGHDTGYDDYADRCPPEASEDKG